MDYSNQDLDILTRTILGEAAGEDDDGQAFVAEVILNRARDSKFPNSITKVARQPKQFSAWNGKRNGGNDLVRKYNPGDGPYDRAKRIAKQVLTGTREPVSGGATHYYAKRGMPGGREPSWFRGELAQQKGKVIQVGNHTAIARPTSFQSAKAAPTPIFANRSSFAPKPALSSGVQAIESNMQTGGDLPLRPSPGINFARSNQNRLTPQLNGILADTRRPDDGDHFVNSGYRDPKYNMLRGGARRSFHMQGKAADLSTKGMSPEQRFDYARDLQRNGANGIITYSDRAGQEKDFIHVDTRANRHHMHNKTQRKMASAPDWHKHLAAGNQVFTPAQAPTPRFRPQPAAADPRPGPMQAAPQPAFTPQAMPGPAFDPRPGPMRGALGDVTPPPLPPLEQRKIGPTPSVRSVAPRQPLAIGELPTAPTAPNAAPKPAFTASKPKRTREGRLVRGALGALVGGALGGPAGAVGGFLQGSGYHKELRQGVGNQIRRIGNPLAGVRPSFAQQSSSPQPSFSSAGQWGSSRNQVDSNGFNQHGVHMPSAQANYDRAQANRNDNPVQVSGRGDPSKNGPARRR
jgi:hypothetical protein